MENRKLELRLLYDRGIFVIDMAKKKVRKKKVLEYTAIFEPEEEGGYSVFVPFLSGCISQGETFEKAVENIKEAIELYFENCPAGVNYAAVVL